MTEDQHTQKATRRCLEMGGPGPHPRGFEWAQQTQSPHSHPVSTAGVPAPGEGGQRLAYLVRSAPGRRPRPDGESAGTGGPSGGCSGRGDGRGAASSAGGGGAGGCMVGGAQDAFLPAEEPLRATHEVSMTLTPMLAGTQRHPGLPPRAGCRAHPPLEAVQQRSPEHLLGQGSEVAAVLRSPSILAAPGGAPDKLPPHPSFPPEQSGAPWRGAGGGAPPEREMEESGTAKGAQHQPRTGRRPAGSI